MKPYSLDLRQKIIDAHKSGAFSQRQLASQFNVALSFIQSLLKRYRDTGSIAPKVRSQQTPTKLNTEQLSILKDLVETHNDATLRELCDLLASKTSVSISISTMDRMLKRLNITSKKNVSCQ